MWNWFPLGSLIINPVYEAGGFYKVNPFYYPAESAATGEEEAKENCCRLSGNCADYYSVRDLDDCSTFAPPRVSKYIIINS